MSITITPNSNDLTLKKGEGLNEVLTVKIPKDVKPSKVDVYFLTDATTSMRKFITSVKKRAESMLNTLAKEYSDIYFGAGYYTDIADRRQVLVILLLVCWNMIGDAVSFEDWLN